MNNLTYCLRCGIPCRTGIPDDTKRAIVAAEKAGYCATCITQRFLMALHDGVLIERLMDQHGPEIFLNEEWRERTFRPLMAAVAAHTQMPEDAIDYVRLAMNWNDPWPKAAEQLEFF